MEAPLTLYVDVHEPDEIEDRIQGAGVPVTRKAITPGDYVVGEVGVERKTIRDFFSSIVNKRLFEQVSRLRETYPRPLVVVEGDLALVDEYANPKVFWGAFLYLHLEEGVPVLFAPNHEHTALLLETLYHQQREARSAFGLRHKPKLLSLPERQEFAVQGLPNVGDTLSKALLERFRTVRGVMTASELDLQRVAKIGLKKAVQITELLDSVYEGQQTRIED